MKTPKLDLHISLPDGSAFVPNMTMKTNPPRFVYVDESPVCRHKVERDELLVALKELLEVAVPMSETAGRDCGDSSMSKARALIARIEGGK